MKPFPKDFDDGRETKNRFSQKEVADRYRDRFKNTRRDWREKKALLQGLSPLSPGASIVDLPCGTGRMSLFLKDQGFEVTGADFSQAMVGLALERDQSHSIGFEKQDVFQTTYPDDAFDGLVCNRLFHHYIHSQTRRKALGEMARITRKIIVVSFFWNLSFSALRFHLWNFLTGSKAQDRIPLWLSVFREDIRSCGLKIQGVFPTRFLISPQTYLRLVVEKK